MLNIGTERSPQSTVRFYLSDDAFLDPSDLQIASKSVGNLQPGNRRNAVFSATVSQNPLGKYLVAAVDADHVVSESNETNNEITLDLPLE